MIGHEQAGDDFALEDMSFHNLRHVGFCADPVPYTLGIDYDTRAKLAMVEAAGFIGTHNTFEIQPFRFALKVGVKRFRS